MSIDETMSQDKAFDSVEQEDLFKFDGDDATSASPVGTEEEESEEFVSEEESSTAEDEETEQKVPYSRFKKQLDELKETTTKMQFLEERLAELEQARQESTNNEDVELPQEWIQLYGDSDVAKQAYKVQLKREEEITERAIKQALERIESRQYEEVERLAENESIIDENLENLSETIGRKLTSKQEEEILSIVDEFSPVGQDGKYVTLFPFNKAYEIYTLRNQAKGQATRQARTAIADLQNSTTESDIDSSSEPFKRGWDSWRETL